MAPFQLCERHETVPIKTDGKKFFSRKNFDGNHLISVLDKDDMFLSEINQWLADHPELLITNINIYAKNSNGIATRRGIADEITFYYKIKEPDPYHQYALVKLANMSSFKPKTFMGKLIQKWLTLNQNARIIYWYSQQNTRTGDSAASHRSDLFLLVLFTTNEELEEIERSNGYFELDYSFHTLLEDERRKERWYNIARFGLGALIVSVIVFLVGKYLDKNPSATYELTEMANNVADKITFWDNNEEPEDTGYPEIPNSIDYLSDIVYAALFHDGIRIRKEPSETSELATDRRIRQGEGLFGTGNISNDGSWAEVYIDGGHTGWIAKSLFETNGNTDAEEWIMQNNISLLQ